jgi:uncharacterized Rossmann fold enzyme
MEFEDWEPLYKEILQDFGWSREKDEEAAIQLSRLLAGKTSDLSILKKKLEGKDVLVCGNALTLSNDLDNINTERYLIIAADGATSTLLEKGIVPDMIVTDLDGYIPDEIEANSKGALMVVHAHGDNIKRLEAVRDMKDVIGTTQAAPLANVYNFGGLSDGDRCVFLAHSFGARSITLAGFNFIDEKVTDIKKKKLKWARKLITFLSPKPI